MQNLQFPVTPIAAQSVTKPSDSGGSKNDTGFGDVLKMQEVDTLLQGSSDYQTWLKIRQNNAALATKIANMALEHYALSQKARHGKTIDQHYYNTLTLGLAEHGLQFPQVEKQSAGRQVEQDQAPAPVSPQIVAEQATNIVPESIINDDNLLILEMKLDKFLLHRGMIGYGNDGNYLLPLGAVAEALDLVIDVAPKEGTASGWYISEDRAFRLDVGNYGVEIDGMPRDLNPGEVELGTDDIYVNSKTLGKWFPADFKVDFSELTVQVDPREKFPVQEKLAREELRDRLERRSPKSKPQLPLATSNYRLFSLPVVDVSSSNVLETNHSKSDFRSTNTIRAIGDLGYMSSDLFISGDDRDPLDNVTWKLERNDPKAGLLGPLRATSLAIGDITTARMPFIQTKVERGIGIHNKDLARESEYDTTRFEGNMSPGWDLEIYRNNSLIAATTVNQDGHYSIENVAVYFGQNKFQIIAYGPQGQKKIEEKIINVGSNMLQHGRSRYDLSFTERDRNTIETSPDTRVAVTKGDTRLVGTYEYGINDWLTASAGGASIKLDGSPHNYLSAGFQGTYAGSFGKADIVQDDNSGTAAQFLVQSSVGPFYLRAKQEFLDNFIEPDSYDESDRAVSRSDLSLSGISGKLGPLPAMPFTLSLQHTGKENSNETSFSGRLSTMFNGTHISNTITARHDTRNIDPDETDGSVYLSRKFGPLYLRANAQYELEPVNRMKNYTLNGSIPISSTLNAQMSLFHSVEEFGETEGSLSLNWDAGRMLISPKLSYDSENNLSAFLNLNFSLGQNRQTEAVDISSQKRANFGSIAALVYHDKNNNQVFDGNDERIKGVEVKAVQAMRTGETDKEGIALLSNLPNFKRSDVVINQDSLEDPFWVPSQHGVSIAPHPGETKTLEFPVVTTGEIDGTLFERKEDGSLTPLRNREIVLYDESGHEIDRIKSEYDGFYLFEKVLPGDYEVELAREDSGQSQSAAGSIGHALIGSDGTVINGLDFVIQGATILAASDRDDTSPEIIAAAAPRHYDRGHIFVRRRDGRREMVQDDHDERPRIRMVTPGVKPSPPHPVPPGKHSGGKGARLVSRIALPQGFQKLQAEVVAAGTTTERLPNVIKAERQQITDNAISTGTRSTAPEILLPKRLNQINRKPEAKTDRFRVKLVSKSLTDSRQYASTNPTPRPRIRLVSKPLTETSRKMPAQPPPVTPEKQAPAGYGVQLASFRSLERAASALNSLERSTRNILPAKSLAIVPVDVGPQKGTWYRIVSTGLSSRDQAGKLSAALKRAHIDNLPVKSGAGSKRQIHLASYRSAGGAEAGLQKIKKEHNDLFSGLEMAIKRVDLGPDKGIWFRVIAGGLASREEAENLGKQLSTRQQYNQILSR